jgi:hypothetical protein
VPIVVHWPSRTGGQRATEHSHRRGEIIEVAYCAHDLVVLLGDEGLTDPEAIWAMRVGGVAGRRCTQWSAASPDRLSVLQSRVWAQRQPYVTTAPPTAVAAPRIM